MEYKVVIANDLGTLEYEVNRLIKQGWKPQGGICVSSMNEYYLAFSYNQAMVKH